MAGNGERWGWRDELDPKYESFDNLAVKFVLLLLSNGNIFMIF